MRDKIQAALESSKADYTEIRVEARETTRVAYRGAELEDAGAMIDKGGIVRCLSRLNGWGVVTFNDLDDLNSKVDQASECARLSQSEEPIELAPVPVNEDAITVDLVHDFRDISLAQKKALAESYNQIMLGASESKRRACSRISSGFL